MKKKKNKIRKAPKHKRGLRDGFEDKMSPTHPLDLSTVKSVDGLVRQMGHTAFGARSVGEAADVLYKMAIDKDCFVVLTLSGAMTVAKMGLVCCEMIDHNMVDAIVSTGALMAHGLIEAIGGLHFKYKKGLSDKELYRTGYDRIYDTLELEKNFDETEVIISKVLDSIDRKTALCSRLLCERLGQHLLRNIRGRGILKSAYQKKVPVYIPAFTDSELGLDLGIYNRRARDNKEKGFSFDPMLDLEHFTDLIRKQKRLGIFTIGGGVPRNWGQQVASYLDITQKRYGKGGASKRYQYGVRICPEPVHWGGLSGCTYSEGISWGKFTPPEEGGRWAEVFADATIAWPLVVKAVLERLKK